MYLARAEARLKDNPDRAEIMADIEQAIAEKCGRYLGPRKTVVGAGEMEIILAEMGPVESAGTDSPGITQGATDDAQNTRSDRAPKRLYQIREGAMLAGVCNGIAAYCNTDVTFIRIAFVLLAFGTFGAAALVYFALAVIIPYADTSEERAEASGCV